MTNKIKKILFANQGKSEGAGRGEVKVTVDKKTAKCELDLRSRRLDNI